MPRRSRPFALALAGALLAGGAAAHPHVFVETRYEVTTTPQPAVQVVWYFDEFYSAMIGDTYDTDKDDAFSPAEVAAIREQVFVPLAEYGYLTELVLDGERVDMKGADRFEARWNGKVVSYRFAVPLPKAEGELRMLGFDEEYFIDFKPMGEEPVRLDGIGDPARCLPAAETRTSVSMGAIPVDAVLCHLGPAKAG
ncbi:MAG TPA: DUF1007 family protein [Alphaproteobacteria bacterium]|nr:DUF1007 family protein [Alphaproteobacteria bacterium]